ncbi:MULTISPECIES: S9 family peptidase [Microbacterium]|uniref:S9 family peptidase n=1 Tax=Microbacterium TaxID=33882 RepID=UPI00277FEF5F|nr:MULTISPECIES: S9 family peptidase [Microbacterium]MDQ1084316.1 dipeptidyl aminopeptidase/acylaminoacyl peptidase [Microbacterium sp. SORGH_AS_0344]MDQ1170408.1 dipeptidyl aminopeptidase/acylaminoacyl peptidase [Microbacterium proteolyticum]
MRTVDIEAFVSVGRPALSSDGGFAVFATSRPDLAADRAVGQLWRVDLPDGVARRLTRGVADRSPHLSPDDATVAFLRADERGITQVFVAAAHGGEPVQVTDQPGGVTDVAWSPDGARLAFTARVPEPGRYGTVEGRDAAAEPPRRVTGIRWHANGLGYLDRPAHLFVVDAPSTQAEPFYAPAPALDAPEKRIVAADAVRLTVGDTGWNGVVWTRDGAELLSVPDVIETDRRDLRSRVVAVSVDGGSEREVLGTAADLAISEVATAPDGTVFVLAYDVGADGVDFIAPGVALHVLDPDGPRRLTDPETIDLGEVGSHLSFDGDDVLVQDRTRGRVRLLRITRGGEATEVLGGDVEVNGHAAAQGRVVASAASPTSFGELFVVDDGGARAITEFGAAARERGIVVPEERQVAGRDGYPVHGWVAAPEGEGPFPVILQIHGGPYASYGFHLFDETQVLVDAGYAVVYSNPRGSAGYGRDHGRSIRQKMGTLDFFDVIDFFDAVVTDDPRLDGDRVGVMGGSYGGYMTAWIIAHDHRFAGAIVERGFLDPAVFPGSSDIGSFFGQEYVGTDPAVVAAQSPMAVVDRVTTPTLVIHSELDLRCPIDQATRYYAALKAQGTEAEMLIFPGEDHELTRAGRPQHRVQRFDAVLEWWERHLPVA